MATQQSPPGPRGLPLLGNTHQWVRDPCRFREDCAAEYGEVVNFELLGWDAYMVTDPDEIERILVSDSDRFPKHSDSNAELTEIVGEGLITSEGELWERQREAIQPAFFMDHIREYADIMVARTEAAGRRWTAGEAIEIRSEMTRLTLEILVEAMFGRDIDIEKRGFYDAVEAFQTPMQPRYQPITFFAPDWAPIPFLRRARRAREHLVEQIYDIVERRRAGEDADRDDLLSMLLSADAAMSDEQIRDEMLTFLFAGHETTALTLTFLWDLLARNPDAERRLRVELDDVVDGRPSVEDAFELEFTEAVVREVLRLYPPAHEIRRQPIEDVEIAGYRVPEGSLLILPTWVMHRDERFWDDPEAFRPSRWLDGETAPIAGASEEHGDPRDADRHEFAYFPFGGGPRHCIGHRFAMTEAQLVVASLARQWTFDREYDELEISAAVTLQPKHDVRMVPRPVQGQ